MKIQPKNPNLFSPIEDEVSAYLLGFVLADGHVTKSGVEIQLSDKDSDFLSGISNLIFEEDKTTHKSTYLKATKKTYNLRRLWINSPKMAKDLENMGYLGAKSFTLQFPSVLPDDLVHHFIRGYFDGDGCISCKTNPNDSAKRYQITIVSSQVFLDHLLNISNNLLGVNFYFHNIEEKIFKISLTGNLQILKFCDWMYKDATLFLGRKRDKYLKLKEDTFYRISRKSSKYNNICYDKSRKKWVAAYRVGNKTVHIGRFSTEDEAYENQQKFALSLRKDPNQVYYKHF